MQLTLVIDFDSTFCKLEALDELATIALRDAPDREAKVREVQAITTAGMEGVIGFEESLSRRLKLFCPTGQQIEQLISLLRANVTTSFVQHRQDIREMAESIYIISGGFKEVIGPVAESFGISRDHILANSFVVDKAGQVVGCDTSNPLSQDDGKVKVLSKLHLPGRVIVVGDGYSDLRTKEAGVADEFIVFTENVRRDGIVGKADGVAGDFGAVLDFCYSVKA